jgi:type II secretory pathway pseudopilin PulG
MIVIAILAILYSIAAANVMGLQNEAKVSRATADLKTLQLAINNYINKYNFCPKKEDYQIVLSHELPNIMVSHLTDPFGPTVNTLYSYETSLNKQNYVAYSIGLKRDGKALIGNDGRAMPSGTAITVTNGYF